jgi:hypothetical protein
VPRSSVCVEINAPCRAVFDVLHDYSRRLEWDTLLSSADLLDGATQAGVGVRSRCVGTWRTGRIPVETEYISFEPGRIAAVRLTNHPPLFAEFSASIRHEPLGDHRSRLTYIYSITTRPALLRGVLDPLIGAALRRETRRRLQALREYVENRIGTDDG